MKILTNEILGNFTPLEPLNESINGKKRLFLEGIYAQADVVNGNRRIYPLDILTESIEAYNNDYIKTKRSIGELNHPDHPNPNPERAAIFIKKLNPHGPNFDGKGEVLDEDGLPCGMVVKCLVDRGVQLGVSTRGAGIMEENAQTGITKISKYKMFAVDVVSNPSAPAAYMKAVTESAEMLNAAGFVGQNILEHTTAIKKMADINEKIIAFSSLLSFLSNR